MLRMQATSNLILLDLKQRVSRIEEAMATHTPVLRNSDKNSIITKILPLQTIESIRDFEALLHDIDEAVVQFVSFYINFTLIRSYHINFSCVYRY